MIDQWRDSQFDLIYNNTATNGYLVPAARTLGCPVLTHVHETAYALRGFNTPVSLNQTLENSDHFLAVSPSVAADLIDCGVQGDRITVIPNFLPVLPSEPDENARQILRAQLNLPPGRPLIVGCGHIHWVKGTDLFVEVASVLAGSTQPKPFFVWLGGETDFEFSQQVRQLVCSRQLVDMVRFVGPVPDAQPWLAASDAVVVTSRVESFSLVALEAAALGRPVAGFADARGLASLLEDEPSQLVAKFDPVAMASVLNEMIRHPSRARQLGLRLRAKVADCFLAGPRVAAILSIVDKLKQDRKNLNKGSH